MGCAGSTVCWSADGYDTGLATARGMDVIRSVEYGSLRRTSSRAESQRKSTTEDAIAIVGIGCRTSGADNIREFWRVLQNGECHVTDVPADRWNAKAFLDPQNLAPGKAYVQKGGFIKDIEGFDNVLYGINDYEASQMDPQQCLLLECTTMALQDAGITAKDISGSSTGVFVGSMNNDIVMNYVGTTTKMTNYTATGISNTILASRLSYVFNLHGPCMVLDTACSASLVAVHQGCLAIRSGDCDMAICGGANCMLTPEMYLQLSKARMISPTGLCHTFSERADGYTRGEGCGIVILKRLKDAMRDGDKVWATVCTGTNQDGHSVTPMTAPSGEQQKKLLQSIYDKHRVDLARLDYIEAHGTGTQAGDPVEVNSLGSFVQQRGVPRQRYIGSVKTNIGHTESAAGVMGLIKVLLMMKHNTIVPSLHCDVVNPKIDLSGSGFVVAKEFIPWTNPHKIAACNSFGFGGSNSHAVVSSFTDPETEGPPRKGTCIVCFSGKTQRALKGSVENLYTDEEAPLLDVHDVAYTSTVRRDHHLYRAAFLAEDMDDLLDNVGEHLSRDQWAPPVPTQLNTVFVFCGMGTAWDGMCRQLMDQHPVFGETMMEVEKQLSVYVSWSLRERLQEEDPSKDPVLGPIAIFACQVALAAVWKSLGIQPSCVVGQSIGEVAAAYTAGCLSLADAVKIIYHRSTLLAQVTGGAMVVVQNVEVDSVRQVLHGTQGKASIALIYSPRACSVSTDSETMRQLRRQLLSQLKSTHQEMRLVELDVSVAYHSHHVDRVAEELKKRIAGINPRAPTLPYLSTVTGRGVQSPPAVEYWADNVKNPVLFQQAITGSVAASSASNTVFLEVGPKPVLRAHLQDLFPGANYRSVPSVSKQPEIKGFYQSVATLYQHGADIDWSHLPQLGRRVMPVPRYSFDKKHQKEKTDQEVVRHAGCNVYKKNHLCVYPTDQSPVTFTLVLSPLTIPSVYQHVVMGKIVIPGALYAECCFALAKYSPLFTLVSVSAEFHQLLPLRKDEIAAIDILPDADPFIQKETAQQSFVAQRNGKQLAVLHVMEVASQPRDLVNLEVVRIRCTEEISKTNIYALLGKFGFEYGTAFSLLEHAYTNSMECLATLQVNELVTSEMGDTTIHPCILDCMIQTTVILFQKQEIPVKEVLPKAIKGLTVTGRMQTTMFVHTRLKNKGSNLFTFELKLTSLDGCVIARLMDFTVQALGSQEEKPLPAMLAVQWEKVKDMSWERLSHKGQPTQGQDLDGKTLLVSEYGLANRDNSIVHLQFDHNSESQNFKSKLGNALQTQNISTISLLISADRNNNSEDAHEMQSRLINLCLLIQEILGTLNDQGYHMPVYIWTFNAWPSVSGKQKRDVSPTETAIWGLLRTLLDELIYPDIVAVEMHTSQDRLDCKLLQSLLHLLMTDKDLANYPEVLVTEEAIYVNQVVYVSSTVSLPERRPMTTATMLNISGDALVLSKEPGSLSNLHVVHQGSLSSSQNHIALKAHSFSRPPEKLYNMRMPSTHIMSEGASTTSDYVVMALEVTGHSVDGSGQELVSCCPMRISPEVLVKAETSLSTSALPQYQSGDLSKLVLLWSLIEIIPSTQFTVLASRACQHLAEIVKALACSTDKEKASDVNIVLIEEMSDRVLCQETMLSLILVDVDTMALVARHWGNAHSLVSLSSLVTGDLHAFMACIMPDVQLCLLSTQCIFQQHHLRRAIPSLKEWIQGNRDLMPTVAKSIHSADVGGTGILELMQFTNINLHQVSVQVVDARLFQKDGAYIVVGGLTGLGWICVEFLAHNNAGCIAIINRRAPSHEQAASMESLSRLCHCKVKSFQADVSSVKSLEKVLQTLSDELSQYGRLRGVFTGAAVVQDGFFPSMDRAAFEKVLSPKVQGTWNLHQLTMHLPLDYFVMHSSVASVLGNQGQANYSTGNAFLDGLAFHRRYLGLAAQSINWGPLDTGILDNQVKMQKRLTSMGFCLTSVQEIKESLPVLMLLNWPQSVPVGLDQGLYAKRMRSTEVEPLIKRLQHLLSVPSQDSSSGGDMENVDKIRFMEPSQRLHNYEAFVRGLAVRLLSADGAQVTSDANLFDLGLDSVTGMMLINIIERSTSFKLPAISVLAGEVTITSLAQLLNKCAGEQQS